MSAPRCLDCGTPIPERHRVCRWCGQQRCTQYLAALGPEGREALRMRSERAELRRRNRQSTPRWRCERCQGARVIWIPHGDTSRLVPCPACCSPHHPPHAGAPEADLEQLLGAAA